MKTVTLFLLIFLGFWSISAQTKACDFKLEVYKYQAITKGEIEAVNGATALLINSKTRKQLKPSEKGEPFIFNNLPEGSYETKVSLPGYKSTTKKFDLTCDLMIDQLGKSEVLFLWEGDSKETIAMFGVSFGVKTPDDSSAASQNTNFSSSSTDGSVNGKVAFLARPPYPPAAMAVRASGQVHIQVTIDELGRVVSARAVEGHPLLRSVSEKAARESKFTTTMLEGMPVKVTGILVYNFSAR